MLHYFLSSFSHSVRCITIMDCMTSEILGTLKIFSSHKSRRTYPESDSLGLEASVSTVPLD